MNFSNIFSFHVVRFDLKMTVALLLTEEKRKANLYLRFRLSIEEAGGAFENRLREGRNEVFSLSLLPRLTKNEEAIGWQPT